VVVSRTVDTHNHELRKKLAVDAADPQLIVTVRRTGYRLAMGAGEPRLPNVRMAPESRSA
jgi:DNA-binding response OmpR family regulator